MTSDKITCRMAMENGGFMKEFLKKKNIIFSAKRYGIDALSAMAQGLFASLLIGTIISTIGEQTGIEIARQIIEKTSDFVDGYYFSFPFNRVYMLEKIMDK